MFGSLLTKKRLCGHVDYDQYYKKLTLLCIFCNHFSDFWHKSVSYERKCVVVL